MDIRYYVRYCDDFAIVEISEDRLENLIPKIQTFLSSELKLYLHEDKVSIRRLGQGIDFLGYVILPGCRVLRTRTKKRIIKRVDSDNLSSYLGILKHCKGQKLEGKIIAIANFSKNRK